MSLLAFYLPFSSQQWVVPFLSILTLLALLYLAAWSALQYLLAQSLPPHQGSIILDGLRSTVTISRDSYGVPSIEAEHLQDLLYGQGFVHAQDRLWQMELNRRVGSGRLAEVFGKEALKADIFLRRLGLKRAADKDLDCLAQQERELLEAYCAGVNAGVDSLKCLPVEFRLLKFKPEAWQALDSLIWIQVMSMDLCSNWEQELLRARLLEKLGPEGAELLHLFTREATQTLPCDSEASEVFQGLWDLYEEAKTYLPNGGLPGGSNAWVVSGSRTKSGFPILANDPHLVGRIPSIWHEARLKCGDLEAQGVSFPGIPFVVIGSNQHVAWGITNSYADTQDLYLEHFLENGSYETENGSLALEREELSISVKGEALHRETVEYTRHGPVLFRSEGLGLALRWMNFEGSRPLATLMAMNLAKNAAEFKEALRHWHAPSSNFVFADTEGNIGYLMAGQVPMRKKGCGLVPAPGWNGEYEWQGVIPFEELPQIDNPACGYLVTANNPVVGPSFPHHISWDWMNPVRAQRIEELLLSQEKIDIDFCRRMQMDVHCQTGLRFAKACEAMSFSDPQAQKAQAMLAAWQGNGNPESKEMALYQISMLSTLKAFLEPLLGESLSRQFLGQSSNPVSVLAGHTGRYTVWLVQILENSSEQKKIKALWPEVPELKELVETALSEAYAFLKGTYGPQPLFWQWGFLHRLQFKHPLAVNPILEKLLNGPAVSAGGDTDTVFQTAVNPHSPYSAEAWCPSFRMVVELSREIQYSAVLPTGQSGHPGSSNYLDQFRLWCEGATRPQKSSKRKVLKLKPRA